MKTIAERVRTIVTQHATDGGHHALTRPLTDQHKFLSDLRMDSLDVVELAMSIEDEFQILIEDSVSSAFKSTADVIAYLQDILPAPAQPAIALPAKKIAEFAVVLNGGNYANSIECVTAIVRMTEVEHGITASAHA